MPLHCNDRGWCALISCMTYPLAAKLSAPNLTEVKTLGQIQTHVDSDSACCKARCIGRVSPLSCTGPLVAPKLLECLNSSVDVSLLSK
eukprot:3714124-Amphidinium_carterae.3